MTLLTLTEAAELLRVSEGTVRAVLTPAEVAEWLSVSESTVREWARNGTLARLPLRKVLILRSSVERLLGGHNDGDGGARAGVDRQEAGGRADPGVDHARRSAGVSDGARDEGSPRPIPARRTLPPRARRGSGGRPQPIGPDARGLPPLAMARKYAKPSETQDRAAVATLGEALG